MDSMRMLGSGAADGFDGTDANEPANEGRSPLMVLHLLLQGRYWLAILLAIVGMGAGAAIGYFTPKLTYTSTGMIHIRPVISPLLFDKAGAMPMYDSFVETQRVMLESERCLDLALSSPRWLDQGAGGQNRQNTPEATKLFKKNLEVTRDGEIIRVAYTDANPKTSTDAVAALVSAYSQLNGDLDPDQPRKRQQQLEALQTDYQTKLAESEKELARVAGPEGTEAMMARYSFKLMEANQAEAEWKLSRSALETFKAMQEAVAQANSTQPAPTTAPAAALTAEQIARQDPEMRAMVMARNAAKRELEQLQALSQVGPNNRELIAKKKTLELLEKQIADFVATWQPEPALMVAQGGGVPQGATLPQLEAKDALDHRRREEAHAEALDLGKKVAAIKSIEAEQKKIRTWLDQTKQQLEVIRVEAAATGRVWVVSDGDRPMLNDKRVQIAAASSFGGGVIGFALVVVLGLFDRRVRTIDQARMTLKQGIRVLGMLPSLPKNLEDPSAASFAALCVHHIRMLLQVMPRLGEKPAIAITSPSPGDGKTSLVLSLALSYAASGKRTLLIDCDMVGAGLTRRVNAIIRRRIGQVLIREKLITPADLREALSLAQRTGRKLGEVLVNEGYVEQAQLDSALKAQSETSVGLLDVMRGEQLEDCVADTGTPRLWILPVGSALAEHGITISPEGFRSVLEQARARFDAILVDTGPIPGSIESSVAASQVDGVVLAVSRGEQGPLVRRANDHIRDLGGRMLGLVFNRATPEDFASSYGAMSSPSIPERVRTLPGTDITQFGPVAAAVAGQGKSLN